MTFMERWLNSLATVVIHGLRDYYILHQAETILDKHFPGEKRSALTDIEKNASLVLQFGHHLLADGWRPTMPNFVQVGMS